MKQLMVDSCQLPDLADNQQPATNNQIADKNVQCE